MSDNKDNIDGGKIVIEDSEEITVSESSESIEQLFSDVQSAYDSILSLAIEKVNEDIDRIHTFMEITDESKDRETITKNVEKWFGKELQNEILNAENPTQKILHYLNDKLIHEIELWYKLEAKDKVIKLHKNSYKGQTREFESLLEDIPSDIHPFPRLIIGRGQENILTTEGCLNLRDQDKTIDSDTLEYPHLTADAWDIDTPQKAKSLVSHGFSAIIFERITPIPLDWSAYLQALCTRSNNIFYELPSDDEVDFLNDLVESIGDSRENLRDLYERNYSFYPELQEVTLPTWESTHICLSDTDYPSPALVNVKSYNDSDYKYPELETALTLASIKNEVLKAYYELLLPGGMIIFSSYASLYNRHGDLIVNYQGKKYTPFRDLNDHHMQAVFANIFERAGFRDIQFYEDPYFREIVIFLVARR